MTYKVFGGTLSLTQSILRAVGHLSKLGGMLPLYLLPDYGYLPRCRLQFCSTKLYYFVTGTCL